MNPTRAPALGVDRGRSRGLRNRRVAADRGDRFVASIGFDPRALTTPYRRFCISARRVHAWREVNELPDRELVRRPLVALTPCQARRLAGAERLDRPEQATTQTNYCARLVRSSQATPTKAGGGPAQQMERR